MKRVRWIALVLALVIVFTGCSGLSFQELMGELGAQMVVPFAEMVYARPDMAKMETAKIRMP